MRLLKWSLLSLWLLAVAAGAAEGPTGPAGSVEDPFGAVRFLVGEWTGTSSGQVGAGTVTRRYEFVLGGRFLHETNVSTYPPNEKNQKGEVHEHLGYVSFDRERRLLVMRQFHVEGFVNQYVLDPASATATRVVFESERFENFDNRWRARETYDILGPDEFTETFELAPPGKPFEVYSKNHFRRVRP